MLDQPSEGGRLGRILLYGKGKTKKTTWAVKAAEAGFNVFHIDGDDGAHILYQPGILSEEARKRVLTINVVDTFERAVFASFMARFCKAGTTGFTWDEQDKQIVLGLRNSEHTFVKIEPPKFTSNDVVIIDSWTRLAASTLFQFAKEHSIDLADAAKVEWDGYGFQGRFLDFVLKSLSAFPCHVIVIGHATVYEKRSKDQKTILSQTTQPISSTGPHGAKLADFFSDVFFFEKMSDTAYYIRTSGSQDRMGGSRHFDAGHLKMEEFPISKLFEKLGSTPSGAKNLGAEFIPKGVIQEVAQVKPIALGSKQTISSLGNGAAKAEVVPAKPAIVSSGGLASRIKGLS